MYEPGAVPEPGRFSLRLRSAQEAVQGRDQWRFLKQLQRAKFTQVFKQVIPL